MREKLEVKLSNSCFVVHEAEAIKIALRMASDFTIDFTLKTCNIFGWIQSWKISVDVVPRGGKNTLEYMNSNYTKALFV